MTDRAALNQWMTASGQLLQEITGCPTPSDGPEPSTSASDGSEPNSGEQR